MKQSASKIVLEHKEADYDAAAQAVVFADLLQKNYLNYGTDATRDFRAAQAALLTEVGVGVYARWPSLVVKLKVALTMPEEPESARPFKRQVLPQAVTCQLCNATGHVASTCALRAAPAAMSPMPYAPQQYPTATATPYQPPVQQYPAFQPPAPAPYTPAPYAPLQPPPQYPPPQQFAPALPASAPAPQQPQQPGTAAFAGTPGNLEWQFGRPPPRGPRVCYRCGDQGHFARSCQAPVSRGNAQRSSYRFVDAHSLSALESRRAIETDNGAPGRHAVPRAGVRDGGAERVMSRRG